MESLAIVLDPTSSYHSLSFPDRPASIRRIISQAERVSHLTDYLPSLEDRHVPSLKTFSSPKVTPHREILCEYLNLFGRLGGIELLEERIKELSQDNTKPDYIENLAEMTTVLKPFANAAAYTNVFLKKELLKPVAQSHLEWFEKISSEATSNYFKDPETVNALIDCITKIFQSLPDCTEQVKSANMLEIRFILNSLKAPDVSFNTRMQCLTELSKILERNSDAESEFNGKAIADWMLNSDLLDSLLNENLHNPQYCEKVCQVLQFFLKQNMLSSDYLDKICSARLGKHETVVKNIFVMLTQLASAGFTSEHFDRLLKQKERLLDLLRQLAEVCTKEREPVKKVLEHLWSLASDEAAKAALEAHLRVLEISTYPVGHTVRMSWLIKLKSIIEEGLSDEHCNHSPADDWIQLFSSEGNIVDLLVRSLLNYLENVDDEMNNLDSHREQISGRLEVIKFFLKRNKEFAISAHNLQFLWDRLVCEK
ncbi:hypothetical protein Ciccas_001545 [Cichlidogyrus casuarinus]|uniref:ubiquitinyl hydrolase 1 n=1 Tax=Cichlidogyrus casuarinus TaxID=1844966 RepID=A0ABD2QJU7_9PLAT